MPLGFSSPVLNAPQSYDAKRRRFINDVSAVTLRPVAGWLPHRSDNLISVDPWSGRVWTAEATMQGRLTSQGKGVGLVMNGTSNFLTSPDTNDTSFGNGTVDTAGGFSIFAVANVTDTAGRRSVVCKSNVANREWHMYVETTDIQTLTVIDESVGVAPNLAGNAVASQGSLISLGGTYSAATGGATAANDMVLYQNGAAIAATATNVGTYVAMENLAAPIQIGAQNTTPASFFAGTLYAVVLIAGTLTAAQMAALHTRCRAYFGF